MVQSSGASWSGRFKSASRQFPEARESGFSVGTRVASLITQNRLASPPLPDLGRDDRHRFTPQGVYISGSIYGDFGQSQGIISNSSYKGTPEGWGGGLAYRSPSIGRVSLFAYGLYTKSSSDYQVTFNSVSSPDLSIENSETIAKSYAGGLSVLLLGDIDTFFAFGAFGGGFYSESETNYDYNYASPPLPGYDTRYYHHWENKFYGYTTGVQAKIRIWKFSVSSVAVYAKDLSNHCMRQTTAAGDWPCQTTVDNSFKSVGVSAGFGGLSVGVYSKLISLITRYDLDVKSYRASYTISF